MIYTAINIGPIYTTISMVRKPRELWQASYLFSHLMKCLINAVSSSGADIISPHIYTGNLCTVGLYPDRVFFKSKTPVDLHQLTEKGLAHFCKDTHLAKDVVDDYFNVMSVSLECNSDKEAVSALNRQLNFLELSNYAPRSESSEAIQSLLTKTYNSPLFQIAFGEKRFDIETLESIATYELKHFDKIKRKSYHNYVCIVQADGDSMGKVVSNLPDGLLPEISKALMSFGENASRLISDYGGLPIYAGGDDLLFIAPVWGGKDAPKHIFRLLEELDVAYAPIIKKVDELLKDANEEAIHTSMSYGVSITYYKYPLYEAWKIANEQLFQKAKTKFGKSKNAIAWKIQKHAGSTYEGGFSKNNKALHDSFGNILQMITSDTLVAAVAHKIRSGENILALLQHSEQLDNRLKAFFDKIIDTADKDKTAIDYIEAVRKLIIQLYGSLDNKEIEDISALVSNAYGMLRTAKFINGEEEKI